MYCSRPGQNCYVIFFSILFFLLAVLTQFKDISAYAEMNHNIGFQENGHFLQNIGENSDHNIDPWSQSYDRELQRQSCKHLQRHE
jgi:hypothetical protein